MAGLGQAAARQLTIGIVAGEPSGDQLGAHLMRALLERRPELRFVGIGGPRMEALGLEILFPMEKLAVHGLVEVLRHYFEIVGIRRRLRQHFLKHRPSLFIGIDSPDFNLDLEAALKRVGIPTVQYVGPTIWAWRRERIHKVKKAVSLVLALYPFEPPLYEQAGVPVRYVGHPLADALADLPAMDDVREELRVPIGVPVVALLPGSRVSELEAMAETFVRAAQLIHEKLPGVRFLVPFASLQSKALFEAAIARAQLQDLPLTMMIGHSLDAMAAADVVLVSSGTAALEAALLKRPMIITYRVNALTWRLVRNRFYVKHAGMPNILAGGEIVPELLQDDATPEKLAASVLAIFADPDARARLDTRFEEIRMSLRQDNAEKVASAIMPLLARGKVT